MKCMVIGAALAAVVSTGALAQQSPGEPVTRGAGSFVLVPYAGYIIYGDLAEFSSGTEFSNDDGALFGVQAGYSFSPNFALLGNFAYNKSKFTLEVPGSGTSNDFNASGDIGIFLYDASLQFRLPFTANRQGSTVAPFVQVGAGAIRYSFDSDDFSDDASDSKVAFNVGLGIDFELNKYIGVRLMAKDYITSLAFDKLQDVDNDSKVSNNFALTAGLKIGR